MKVTPRAKRDEILGIRDGALALRVTAPPVDDKANRAVIELIAKCAGVPRNRVRIVKGRRGRRKLVEIDGAEPAALERLMGA